MSLQFGGRALTGAAGMVAAPVAVAAAPVVIPAAVAAAPIVAAAAAGAAVGALIGKAITTLIDS
ncbi:hypothetical protein [Nocardia bovistercoris]|uniref:Uncharacterized protein n=1 Tax=Nocardia bovistercoris TaxID=2785916 RepID=A0A931I655_9NOCA|nr:hypothetical protein [Nocardia bovistercoris]MBH0775299.1 hypothetical protein [Nocardia bovistercoris]